MDAITAGLIGTCIGGTITAVPTIITAWIGKRSEERRHMRDLCVKAAIENWKTLSARNLPTGAPMPPIDSFILHMAKFSELFLSGDIDATRISKNLNEVYKVVDAALLAAARRSTQGNQQHE